MLTIPRLRLALCAALLFAPIAAQGQSSPGLSYGQVPTAGQLNSFFSAKQDLLRYTPLNQAGGTMAGHLSTAPSTVNGAGFTLSVGGIPQAPNNGDLWATSTGFFGQINSGTIQFAPQSSVAAETSRAQAAEATKAPIASPTFTGTATIPTLAISGSGSTGDGSGLSVTAGGSTSTLATRFPLLAPLASPNFTGTASLIAGMTTSPTVSYGGLTYQTNSTTAANVLGPQQPAGYFTVDGIRSTVVGLADATATTTSSFGFYALNNSTKNVAGLFGTSVCALDGCSVWGLNPTVIDATANGTVTSGANRKLIGAEFDISVTSPNTTVTGISLLGSSISQPAFADGFSVGDLNASSPGVKKWTHGFIVTDGTANIGYLTGSASLTGANVAGTPNYLNYRDASNVGQAVRYRSTAGGALFVDSSVGPNGISFQPAAAGQYPTLRALGTDTNIGLNLQGQGTGQVIAQSLLNAAQGLYAGTSAQFGVPVQLALYTVAGLPTCNTAARGSMAAVTDATAPTYNGALTGGGTVSIPVYCRGDIWTAH